MKSKFKNLNLDSVKVLSNDESKKVKGGYLPPNSGYGWGYGGSNNFTFNCECDMGELGSLGGGFTPVKKWQVSTPSQNFCSNNLCENSPQASNCFPWCKFRIL
jgi:hypothetical protein